jgi:hypothetical protein
LAKVGAGGILEFLSPDVSKTTNPKIIVSKWGLAIGNWHFWGMLLPPGRAARTMIEVAEIPNGALTEIEAITALDGNT